MFTEFRQHVLNIIPFFPDTVGDWELASLVYGERFETHRSAGMVTQSINAAIWLQNNKTGVSHFNDNNGHTNWYRED